MLDVDVDRGDVLRIVRGRWRGLGWVFGKEAQGEGQEQGQGQRRVQVEA